jgi:16S rRNA A1518/A1519 N6-dimethyltransferase RsmA/KsgA/DIM1 with predicted DNA glycosylase/AP lyase activity
LQAGATVLALEKDYALAEKMEEEYVSISRFKVVQGDALRVNLPELIMELRRLHSSFGISNNGPTSDLKRIKVVANLPYYITTGILKIMLPMGADVSHMAFMVQDEVALRLTNPHPSKSSCSRCLILGCKHCLFVCESCA